MKKIDKIMMLVQILIIIVFSFIIGANEKGLRIITITALLSLELIFLIIKKIVFKKSIIIKNKIDIFVLLFFLVTFIPLIFKTYSTFNGTIEFIIKYFFVYSYYLCIRNIEIKNKTIILLYTIVITSIIFFVFAIDMINNNIFEKVYNYLDINYLNVKYLSGTFGYKNALAIYYLACFYISIYLINNTKKIPNKIFLCIYLLFSLVCIFLTSSRIIILLTILSFITYLIIINFNIVKKHFKNIIITLCSIILFGLIIFFVFCNKSEEFNLYKNESFIINYDFKSETTYDLVFYSKSNEKYEINIEETTKNFKKINSKYFINPSKESDNLYKYTLKYKTSIKPYRFKINFKENNDVIINKLLINNKEYILKYKYIPYKISYYISMVNIKDYSIYQRLVYYKDSIKIFKKSPLIGQGGNTWKARSFEVQNIEYNIKETHSYFFELLISYGIFGVILFTSMIIIFNINLIKYVRKDISYLPLLFSVDLIILHSYIFDFDMSFIVVMILVYTLIALLTDKISNQKYKYNNVIDRIILILFILILSFLYIENILRNNNSSLFYRNIRIKTVLRNNKKDRLDNITNLISDEPYYYQIILQENYIRAFKSNYTKFNEKDILEKIKFFNEYKSNYNYKYKFKYDNSLYYTNLAYDFYNYLNDKNIKNKKIDEELLKLKNNIIKESKRNISFIKNTYDIDDVRKNVLINNYREIINYLK